MQAGDWSPFGGFSVGGRPQRWLASDGTEYPPEWHDPITPGTFVKDRINFGLRGNDPLFNWGTEANRDIHTWLGERVGPGRVARPWQPVQGELVAAGVATRDPVGSTYYLGGR